MKQDLNSYSNRIIAQQLVVPRSNVSIRSIPKTFWISMVFIAMVLLAGASIIRERDGLKTARASNAYAHSKLSETQSENQFLRRNIQAAKTDPNVIEREAQKQLNVVKKNEIVVVMK